ncbi:MAG: hemerythrin domain-containing protein [Nocardioides sp.]
MTIETRMNGIIHAALRRDLDRLALLLERPEDLSPSRLQALGAHARWLMDVLHEHHTGEDDRLFPMIRRNNPGVTELLDAMVAEHEAIAAAVSALEGAGARAESGEAGAAEELRGAVAGLRAVLDPHLEHEERDLTPVVPQSVSEAEWEEFEQSNTEGKKPPELAFRGHWIIDNLDPAGVAVVTGLVPAVPRFIMVRLMGGAYRRRREQLWGGTPALAVRSEPRAT